jgi:death-on-curing protein
VTHPRFLFLEDVLRLHRDQIDRYGGSHGVRDYGLLESALAQPQVGFGDEYVHKNIFEMSSDYLFHLVQNHPFNDGNKRIGAYCAIVFLFLNGFKLGNVESDFEALVMATACGEKRKPEIAEFLRMNCSSFED